jgi:hypothetical protein
MLSLGAVVIEPGLKRTFYRTFRPVANSKWEMDTVPIHGFTPDMASGFPPYEESIREFAEWLKGISVIRYEPHLPKVYEHPTFISDTSGYDWLFVAYYLGNFAGVNPFGWSAINIVERYESWRAGRIQAAMEISRLCGDDLDADFYTLKGRINSMQSFGKLKTTPHDHNALNDAMGVAESALAAQVLGFSL